MKKITAIFAALLMLCAHAETTPAPGAVYKILTAEDAPTYAVEFADVFSLEFPVAWQEQPISPEQTDAGVIACFSDGAHFVNITLTDDEGIYADTNAYALAISENYDSTMVTSLGGTDFVCSTDTQSLVSQCATIIAGAGIYTFRFYPTGDAEFARTILDIMDSFNIMEVTGQ